jgi:glycosyltransferase involved in cell wall biosynthesis
MFRDRAPAGSRSLGARLLKSAEGRALRAADIVHADTRANALRLAEDFQLARAAVRSVPLAIDEQRFLAIPPKPRDEGKRIDVLFVGTMIPLHGLDVIAGAIEALRDDERFHFHLVGDGEQGHRVASLVSRLDPARIQWTRGWQTLDEIAGSIAQSDICLGVFGGDGKAARVLPLKLYMYLAAGRAVVSQRSFSVPGEAPPLPIVGVDANADALLRALRELAATPVLRHALGEASRSYYRRWLSNAAVLQAWDELPARLSNRRVVPRKSQR